MHTQMLMRLPQTSFGFRFDDCLRFDGYFEARDADYFNRRVAIIALQLQRLAVEFRNALSPALALG